tara:strand:+ start:63 stop:788 length:726 start_codon:yes stop_codon:yes gene_type:complete
MRAIIYAAGVSRRLKNIAGNGLKGLLELNGKRIIEYQLDWIIKLPISEVIIVLGLEHEPYVDLLGKSYKGMPLVYIYNPDYKDKGNMLSLWHAREFCNTKTLFTTSDLICHEEDIEKFSNSKAENKILIDNKSIELYSDPDPVKVTIQNGTISKILKNGDDLVSIDGIAVGVYQFSNFGIKCIIESIDRKIRYGNDNLSLYYALDNVLQDFIVKPIFTEKCEWIDIDTPDDLEQAISITTN